MCGHGAHGPGEHFGRRRRGFGFGRGGFPNRDEWLERLQAYQQQLEQDLKNVQELIERLGPPSPQQTANL